jgi:hypothetical protein
MVGAVEIGRFEQRGRLDADRGAARLELSSARAGTMRARAERIRSEGDTGPGRTERLSTSLSRALGSVTPQLALSRETRRSGRPDSLTGSRRDRGVVSISAQPHPALRLGGELGLEEARLREAAAGIERTWFHANEEEVSATITPGEALSFASRYRRRGVNYTSAVRDPDATSHLGRVEVRQRALEGAVVGEYDYDVTTFEAARRRRVLVAVPAGEVGDYDSLGNFIPGQGTFRASEIDIGTTPTTELAASARVVLDPARWLGRSRASSGAATAAAGAVDERGWRRFLRGVRLESLARVSERSTTSRKTRLLLLDPDEFQRDDTTVRGEIALRQEATWRDRGASGALVSARFGRVDVEDNAIEGAAREELRHEGLLRGRRNLSRRVSAQLDWEPRRSRQRHNGAISSRLLSDFFELTGTYQPTTNVTASLSGRYGREREPRLDERLDSFETAASASVASRGRVSARVATLAFLTDRRGRSGASPLTTRQGGQDWRLSADYDLSRYLATSIVYSGDNRRSGGATHDLRMEARALF